MNVTTRFHGRRTKSRRYKMHALHGVVLFWDTMKVSRVDACQRRKKKEHQPHNPHHDRPMATSCQAPVDLPFSRFQLPSLSDQVNCFFLPADASPNKQSSTKAVLGRCRHHGRCNYGAALVGISAAAGRGDLRHDSCASRLHLCVPTARPGACDTRCKPILT